MAEALHHHVSREAQAGQILELVTRHGAGGVLGAHGGHARFAVGAGPDALLLAVDHGHAAGTAHHLLGQGVALAAVLRRLGQAEDGRSGQPQELSGLGRQRTADDQVDAAAGAHFIEQHVVLELELLDHLAVAGDLALIGMHLDHVAHVELAHFHFDGQGAGVFLGVEEDRGDLAAQGDAAKALVGHEGNVLSGDPDDAVGGALA